MQTSSLRRSRQLRDGFCGPPENCLLSSIKPSKWPSRLLPVKHVTFLLVVSVPSFVASCQARFAWPSLLTLCISLLSPNYRPQLRVGCCTVLIRQDSGIRIFENIAIGAVAPLQQTEGGMSQARRWCQMDCWYQMNVTANCMSWIISQLCMWGSVLRHSGRFNHPWQPARLIGWNSVWAGQCDISAMTSCQGRP